MNTYTIRYPWQVFFIIVTEACERFCYYGMNGKKQTAFFIYLYFYTINTGDENPIKGIHKRKRTMCT